MLRLAALVSVASAAGSAADFSASVNDASFIASVNEIPGSWRASPQSKFEGMTLAQARVFMGAKRDAARRAALPVSDLPTAAAIPANFNSTSVGPQCASGIGHIRDRA